MGKIEDKRMGEKVVSILTIGAVWGIFEATVGFLLHLLPVRIGFLVWYPVAVFFMMTAYQKTEKKTAILAVAGLAAAIKLLNLMLPGHIDRVINPAVSVLCEGIAVFAAICFYEHSQRPQKAGGILLLSIGMNTLWRALYLGYLALLVPEWIREASVLKSSGDLFRFIAVDNLCSSLIVFVGMLAAKRLKRYQPMLGSGRRSKAGGLAGAFLSAALLAVNITLQMIL